MNNKPTYYAILPAIVRYDKRLKPIERIIYAEITTLCNKTGYCTAKNSYFSKAYELHKSTISSYINNLIKAGHITSKIMFEDNTKRVIERRLYIVPIHQTANTPILSLMDTPIHQTTKDNNTSINNTSNNILCIDEIIKYLNEKRGSKFKATANPTKTVIKARINEGYKLEDFKKVIDNMIQAADNGTWGKGMHKYLRPTTLFGTKFENYLNWPEPKESKLKIKKQEYDNASNEW